MFISLRGNDGLARSGDEATINSTNPTERPHTP